MTSTTTPAAAASGGIELLQTLSGDDATEELLLDSLEETLLQQQDFHRLFDASLIRIRRDLGLSVTQPTSLDGVPKDREAVFREGYINAARRVGRLFLDAGKLSDAWAYFRTIGEPQPVKDAIDQIPVPREPDDDFDAVLNVALYEGAHIVRGLEFLLKTHGTCNTITAFSQVQQQMSSAERRAAAAMMVRQIYGDLQQSIRRQVESRNPALPPNASIAELMAGREWLFADGNYHIDVSHLHSTVGFARALQRDDPELKLAIELCDYGSHLADQLQYPGDVPFDEYYTAHHWFLTALAGRNVDDSLSYFKQRLQDEPEISDRQLIAFVLLDLAQRVNRTDEVLELAAPYVGRLEDPAGFSFSALCAELGRCDVLEDVARNNDDVIAYVTAKLLAGKSGKD
ncbi:MAG: hypothetical protein R3C19_14835 [Planctomycetaceae bacterium]